MSISTPKILLPVALSFTLLLTLALPAAAQSRAIKGKVTDQNGKPVADAQVTIQGMDVYRNLTTKTNKKGEYLYILGMQSGLYRVIVRKAGFQPAYKENIRPEMQEQSEVDFTLEPGEDQKLPFEMTDAEREEFKKKYEAQEKRRQFSAEVKAHFDNGIKLSDAGDYEGAIKEFNQALELDPTQSGIVARIADVYFKMGNNDQALADYKKAIEMNPNDPTLYTNMGVVLSKMGKTAESQEAFKKAASMNPASAAQNYYNLGITLVNSGNSEEAATAFKQAIAADPNYAEAYYQLGMSLSGKQDTIPAAIEALKKYLQIGQKPDQIEVAKQIIAALGGK
jgi:tetratricopeptide (TPR) repeat protein